MHVVRQYSGELNEAQRSVGQRSACDGFFAHQSTCLRTDASVAYVCVPGLQLLCGKPLLEQTQVGHVTQHAIADGLRALKLWPRGGEAIDTYMKRTAWWCGSVHEGANVPHWDVVARLAAREPERVISEASGETLRSEKA